MKTKEYNTVSTEQERCFWTKGNGYQAWKSWEEEKIPIKPLKYSVMKDREDEWMGGKK